MEVPGHGTVTSKIKNASLHNTAQIHLNAPLGTELAGLWVEQMVLWKEKAVKGRSQLDQIVRKRHLVTTNPCLLLHTIGRALGAMVGSTVGLRVGNRVGAGDTIFTSVKMRTAAQK